MPTKAAYKRFEADPEFEFEFYLAQKLGMTVARLRVELSNDEFVYWSIYFGRVAQQRQLATMKGGA